MAELNVATKAPESDAQEPAPEQTAPKLSQHCTTSRPTPSGQASTGEITKLGGIDVYISKPSDYPHAPTKLLLLLTGGTGLKSVNNQVQADRFASEGFVVVMPDLFDGDPAPNSGAGVADELQQQEQQQDQQHEEQQGGAGSLLDALKNKAVETAKSFLIDMWLARHTEEKVLPLLHKVLDATRDEFADAVAGGGGVYAVGYCFGARYVLLLARERRSGPQAVSVPFLTSSATGTTVPKDEEASRPKTLGPFIKAGALAHPTLVSRDDFIGLKAPLSLVCAEVDPMFPDDVRTAGEDYMSKNNIEHEVRVYPGVPHGFAVVGEYEDTNIQTAQGTAFEQMLNWLQGH